MGGCLGGWVPGRVGGQQGEARRSSTGSRCCLDLFNSPPGRPHPTQPHPTPPTHPAAGHFQWLSFAAFAASILFEGIRVVLTEKLLGQVGSGCFGEGAAAAVAARAAGLAVAFGDGKHT